MIDGLNSKQNQTEPKEFRQTTQACLNFKVNATVR